MLVYVNKKILCLIIMLLVKLFVKLNIGNLLFLNVKNMEMRKTK